MAWPGLYAAHGVDDVGPTGPSQCPEETAFPVHELSQAFVKRGLVHARAKQSCVRTFGGNESERRRRAFAPWRLQ